MICYEYNGIVSTCNLFAQSFNLPVCKSIVTLLLGALGNTGAPTSPKDTTMKLYSTPSVSPLSSELLVLQCSLHCMNLLPPVA